MNRKSILFIAILLLLQNLMPNFAKTRAFNEDVLPPDILPVVILTGSDYEMGYQYGRQAGHLIIKTKRSGLGRGSGGIQSC